MMKQAKILYYTEWWLWRRGSSVEQSVWDYIFESLYLLQFEAKKTLLCVSFQHENHLQWLQYRQYLLP